MINTVCIAGQYQERWVICQHEKETDTISIVIEQQCETTSKLLILTNSLGTDIVK